MHRLSLSLKGPGGNNPEHHGSETSVFCSFLKEFIYLFLERGERKEKERERKKMCKRNSDWLPLSHPNWGPGRQPRHVP